MRVVYIYFMHVCHIIQEEDSRAGFSADDNSDAEVEAALALSVETANAEVKPKKKRRREKRRFNTADEVGDLNFKFLLISIFMCQTP